MSNGNIKKDVTSSSPKQPTVKVVSVGLTDKQRKMLETLAEFKYRIPQNLSHTLRLLIEDAFTTYEVNKV